MVDILGGASYQLTGFTSGAQSNMVHWLHV
jgi:hypothetical protein